MLKGPSIELYYPCYIVYVHEHQVILLCAHINSHKHQLMQSHYISTPSIVVTNLLNQSAYHSCQLALNSRPQMSHNHKIIAELWIQEYILMIICSTNLPPQFELNVNGNYLTDISVE